MSFTYLQSPENYNNTTGMIDRQHSRSPTANKRYGFVKSESLTDTDTCSDRTSEEENDYRRTQQLNREHSLTEQNVKKKERKTSLFNISSSNNNNNSNNNNSNNNNNNNNHNNDNNNNNINNNNNSNGLNYQNGPSDINSNVYANNFHNNMMNNHVVEEKRERKNSQFSISNVKRKLSHTFQRKNSTSTSPELSRRKAPLKNKNSNLHNNNMHISPNSSPPELRRYAAMKNMNSHNEARWKGSSSMANMGGHKNPEPRGSNNLMHPLVMSRKRSTGVPPTGTPLGYSSNPNIIDFKESMKDFNIHCLGTKQTGKTALTVRFLTGRYIHEYTSSPVEKYSRVMKYGEDHVNVTVFINDVDRMEEDIELGANSGIMIIYSITDKTSFKEATLLLNHLQELSITDHIPVVLIATKMDLNRLRKIKEKRGLDLANQFNCSQFDVSAAQDENVQDCFHAVFRQIEVRQFLKGNSEDDKTILTPRKFKSSGSFRYSTL